MKALPLPENDVVEPQVLLAFLSAFYMKALPPPENDVVEPQVFIPDGVSLLKEIFLTDHFLPVSLSIIMLAHIYTLPPPIVIMRSPGFAFLVT